MEFKIPVAEMQEVVHKMSNIVNMNEDDMTSMILIDVKDVVKFYCASASITTVILSEECEIIDKGRALIKFKDVKEYLLKFVPLADNYGTENFHFISKDNKNVIKSKTIFPSGKPSYRNLKFRLYNDVYNIKSYKIPEPFDLNDTQLIINSSTLKQGIARVLYCINPEEIRESLSGLNVTAKGNKVVFTGTDGVKLVEFITNIDAKMEQFGNILNSRFASTLYNLLEGDTQVFMKFEYNKIYIVFDNLYVIGTLVVGEEYPEYKQKLALNDFITLPRVDFVDSVFSAMAVLDEEDNNRLTIQTEGSKLILKNDQLEAVHEFDDVFESDLEFDVNGAYLASILKDFSGDNLKIYYENEDIYIVIKSEEADDHTALLTTLKRR